MGFTETGTTLNGEGNVSTCIDYLKQLGVTTVQINPFYDFQSIDEAGSNDQFNWGYDPQNYNVPEGSYSTNPYDGNVRIEECKAMVKALHDAGSNGRCLQPHLLLQRRGFLLPGDCSLLLSQNEDNRRFL